MPNNRSQYYTHCRQRHIAEYPETARTYLENNRDEITIKDTLIEKTWNYSEGGVRV